MGPEPDEKWQFTDAHGHEHHYAPGYPTLRWIVDETWTDEFGDEMEDGHYECPRCGEHIAPGLTFYPYRRYIAGPTEWTLNGQPITEDEARAWLTEQDTP